MGTLVQGRILLDASPASLRTVHLRHHHVEENQVRLKLPRRGQRLEGLILRAHRVVAGAFEVHLHGPRDAGLVINDENAFLCHGSFLDLS